MRPSKKVIRYGLLAASAFILYTLIMQSTRGWYSLRWVDNPPDSTDFHAETPAQDRTHFDLITSYHPQTDDFAAIKNRLHEGDVIAYRMKRTESAFAVAKGKLNTLGYQILDYGHLAMIVQQNGQLVLFSSQSFKGPNTEEDIHTLSTHAFDVYRLNQWPRVNTERLYQFVDLAQDKAKAWYGYDFSGMFGLWNSNLQPNHPHEIGHDYICSTIVLAALHYSGVELNAIKRGGILDLVTPKQVCTSQGRIIPTPNTNNIAAMLDPNTTLGPDTNP